MGTAEENFRNILLDFEKKLNERWELLSPPVKLVKNLNYLDRSIMFPYAQIETEPTLPFTSINFRRLERSLQTVAKTKPVMRAIGNVQTLLVQLPNVFYFASFPWKRDTKDAS